MAKIPAQLPKPKRIGNRAQRLKRSDYRWLVDRRAYDLNAGNEPLKNDKHYDSRIERIIGSANFLQINFLAKGREKARSVCRIEMSNNQGWNPWGTGFLIAPNILMTNNHVFKEPAWAANARLLFNDELDNDDNPLQPEIYNLDPDSIFITNQTLDFTICGVRGNPETKYGYLQINRDPQVVSRHDRVNIIQHPQGRRKEVTLQGNKIDYVRSYLLLYTTDTEPGSSGSPVFTNKWELVGLHHAGGDKNPDGSWKNNEGIRIASIVRYLDHLAERENYEGARKVIGHAIGRNPYEGIFKFHGRKSRMPKEWPVEERVVYDYQGTDAYLDVGFWNIQHFNKNSSISRRRRVADLLDHLSLDAIGLVEVGEEAVKWVVNELNERGLDYEYIMQDVRGSQDLAIIYDTSTLKAKKVTWSKKTLKAFSKKVSGTGKIAWYRTPLLARLETTKERSADGAGFDFLMCVIHAKATTHYDEPGIPQIVRRASAELLADALAQKMKSLKEDDVLVGGDYNARLEEQSFSALKGKLRAVALTTDDARGDDPDAYTYLGSQAGLIDHIYTTPGAYRYYDPGSISVTRVDTQIPDFYTQLSDHAPIIARFTFWGTDDTAGLDEADRETPFEVRVPPSAKRILLTRKK